MILDLINQVPLSIGLRSKAKEFSEKIYELKFMELVKYFQDAMFERDFKNITHGTINPQ